MKGKKSQKRKVEIVFDAKKRREFLTGFRKRKNERRKRAKEELERNLKEERKRIRKEIKDGVKHMKKSYEPLKELTEADKINDDEYEDNDVKVKIVELSVNDLTSQRNMLGQNFTQDIEDDVEKDCSSDIDDAKEIVNCIPGMDFDINLKRTCKSEDSEENVKNNSISKSNITIDRIKSKKDLDRFKKTKTLKKLKKSKIFKMKERLDKKANQKNVRRVKNNILRSLPKHLRKQKKYEKNPYSKGRKMNKKQLKKKYEN